MNDWVTSDEVIQELADRLHQDVSVVATRYTRWAESTTERAIGELKGALLGKGYAIADINRWKLKHPYSLDLAAFYAAEKARSILGGTQDSQPLEATNPLKQFDAEWFVLVMDDDTVASTAPAGGAVDAGLLRVRQDFDAAVARDRCRPGSFWDEQRRGRIGWW